MTLITSILHLTEFSEVDTLLLTVSQVTIIQEGLPSPFLDTVKVVTLGLLVVFLINHLALSNFISKNKVLNVLALLI